MIELDGFGWNALTVSVCITALFGILAAWGLAVQARKTWRATPGGEHAGDVESVPWFVFFVAVHVAAVLHGRNIHSLLLIAQATVNACIATVIVAGIWRLKRFTGVEWCVIGGLVTTLVFAIFADAVPIVYIALMYLCAVVTLHQPYKILQKKRVGTVSFLFCMTAFLNSSFWCVYSFASGDTTLQVVTVVYPPIYLFIVILWVVYRPRSIA